MPEDKAKKLVDNIEKYINTLEEFKSKDIEIVLAVWVRDKSSVAPDDPEGKVHTITYADAQHYDIQSFKDIVDNMNLYHKTE